MAGGARPAVGRTTCAEILHGSRSKKIQRNSYDGLPAYGVSAHMRRADILARVDELIGEGRLETTRRSLSGAAHRRVSFRIAVLVSGEGSNLQALIDDLHDSDAEIVGVASSRAEARGLERANEADIETAVFSLADEPDRARRDEALAGWLEERGVELVVLAGFMELLTPGLHPPLRGPHRERPPGAAAGLPGSAAPSSRRSSTGSRSPA